MIKDLIKVANKLDFMNLISEADQVDMLIRLAAEKDLAIQNDLKIPVSISADGGTRFSVIKPGNLIGTIPGKKVVVKWKNSGGAEETLTLDWNVINSAPKESDMVKLSILSDKLSGIGLAAVIDESRRNKTLKDNSGYIYQVGWNGEFLKWSRDGKNWNLLNQSYPRWSEVVSNINKIKV